MVFWWAPEARLGRVGIGLASQQHVVGISAGAVGFVAEERLVLRSNYKLFRKAHYNLPVQQPLPVLNERGGLPDRIIRAQTNKPEKQQDVVQLLQ